MGLSGSTFRRIKKEAIFLLATRLGLIVWSESEFQQQGYPKSQL
ncbi:hypothetical protein PPE_06025 [Paenibacillus polymyxa E681]|nr:hypothetical protein PPE_06025 [Paenibacillus polymyxa E681]